MFTQAFRYAYEPFIFAQAKGENKSKAYCDAMKYFIIFGLLIFLGVMYYLPVLKHFISPPYWSGLRVGAGGMMMRPSCVSEFSSIFHCGTSVHRPHVSGECISRLYVLF